MADCGYKGCKNILKTDQEKKNKVCDQCRKKKQDAEKVEQQKLLEKKKADENKAKIAAAAAESAKKDKWMADKKAEIAKIAATWNQQITAAATQVKNLRAANPTRQGINAGTNAGLPTIPGGNKNAIKLVLPSNTFKITKAEVAPLIAGFDGSDSGTFKYRRGDKKDILIHCE
jgi:hypothetical protein